MRDMFWDWLREFTIVFYQNVYFTTWFKKKRYHGNWLRNALLRNSFVVNLQKLMLFFITHEKSQFAGNRSSDKKPEFLDLVDHKSPDFQSFPGPRTPLIMSPSLGTFVCKSVKRLSGWNFKMDQPIKVRFHWCPKWPK